MAAVATSGGIRRAQRAHAAPNPQRDELPMTTAPARPAAAIAELEASPRCSPSPALRRAAISSTATTTTAAAQPAAAIAELEGLDQLAAAAAVADLEVRPAAAAPCRDQFDAVGGPRERVARAPSPSATSTSSLRVAPSPSTRTPAICSEDTP